MINPGNLGFITTTARLVNCGWDILHHASSDKFYTLLSPGLMCPSEKEAKENKEKGSEQPQGVSVSNNLIINKTNFEDLVQNGCKTMQKEESKTKMKKKQNKTKNKLGLSCVKLCSSRLQAGFKLASSLFCFRLAQPTE